MIWKTLRVSEGTLASLQRYRDNLQVQVTGNRGKYPRFAPTYRVSLSEAIDFLIAQKDSHTSRSKGGFRAGGRPKDQAADAELARALGNDSEFEERTSHERP